MQAIALKKDNKVKDQNIEESKARENSARVKATLDDASIDKQNSATALDKTNAKILLKEHQLRLPSLQNEHDIHQAIGAAGSTAAKVGKGASYLNPIGKAFKFVRPFKPGR